jgi:hypothetical protein
MPRKPHLHWAVVVDLVEWEASVDDAPLDQQRNKAGGCNSATDLAHSSGNMAKLLLRFTTQQQVMS